MRHLHLHFVLCLFSLVMFLQHTDVRAQASFDPDEYAAFLEANTDMTVADLKNQYPLKGTYYKGFEEAFDIEKHDYLDSVIYKYELTNDELNLLEQNQFLVTERLSYSSFGQALQDVYHKDLPIMVTTDQILHALHKSYDDILKHMELQIMVPNLNQFLKGLYETFPSIYQNYADEAALEQSLKDIDLYATIAYSLTLDELQQAHISGNQSKVESIWADIKAEEFKPVDLFTQVGLPFDFSQLKPRGHYVRDYDNHQDGIQLEKYFRSMMWVGRAFFYLTPPPPNYTLPLGDLERNHFNAVLLSELMAASGKENLMDENNKIIDYFVGTSDNLTPQEHRDLMARKNIKSVRDLIDRATFDDFYAAIQEDDAFKSRIASYPYFSHPNQPEAELPIQYKLSGQRFILDSYVAASIVYDRIQYQGQKIFRPLPDPVDPMIVLGNNDGIWLMEKELEQYHYSSNIASLRYLVEHQEQDYWTKSLYGSWLNAIRSLAQPENHEALPAFMQTAAWQQEKMNTQLAAWTQLRHDNLLYAAQSYTGGVACSFPHVYVEPYPAFYEGIADFSTRASTFIGGLAAEANDENYTLNNIRDFFSNFAETSNKLKELANKELRKEPFTDDETDFVRRMLFDRHEGCTMVLDGWYVGLFYLGELSAQEADFITADVHTQTTDELGNIVGNVLHAGTGMVNLGVFLVKHPSCEEASTAFMGAVSSYYPYVKNNFKRMTDQEWAQQVWDGDVPARPDWVNIYLADQNGAARPAGTELPSVPYNRATGIDDQPNYNAKDWSIYPNPARDFITLSWESSLSTKNVQMTIYNQAGQLVKTITQLPTTSANQYTISIDDLTQGIYYCRLQTEEQETMVKKLIVIQ